MDIVLSRVQDIDALGKQWRDLEERSELSFFQSWTWMGCLIRERFSDPFVLVARTSGRIVAMGLFNHPRAPSKGHRLLLAESGHADLDVPYIEHSGFLVEHGQPHDTIARLVDYLHQVVIGGSAGVNARSVIMSGIDADTFFSAWHDDKRLHVSRIEPAWVADLARLRSSGQTYLGRLGPNTRHMIRQSRRSYQCEGHIKVTRAATLSEANLFLSDLIRLHQSYWQSRGQPGAFHAPFFERFHRMLIATGLPRDEIDLLQVSTPARTLGVLYNFRHRKTVYSYQSGFNYDAGDKKRRPGIVAHATAIEMYMAAGLDRYDFLAGHADYKNRLGDTYSTIVWCRLAPASLFGTLAAWFRRHLVGGTVNTP